ncbi:MAG: hypothetical protein CMF49_00515 [Legionellales bacterium]|nr:hypothetical protein [Legionellales bacterium]
MKTHCSKKVNLGLIGLIVYLFTLSIYAANLSPQGSWLTIDDVTKKPRSIVKITENNGHLYGNITKVYYRKGEGPNDVCEKCSGARKNQKFLGMNILWGMKKTGKYSWSGGKILDPENGKTYKCIVTLSQDGQQLNVRGYIGISLLGRTQMWIRQ